MSSRLDAEIAWRELREVGVIDPEQPSPFAPDWRTPLQAEFTPRERLEIRLRLGLRGQPMSPRGDDEQS